MLKMFEGEMKKTKEREKMIFEIQDLYRQKCDEYLSCIEEIIEFGKKNQTEEMFHVAKIIKNCLTNIEKLNEKTKEIFKS